MVVGDVWKELALLRVGILGHNAENHNKGKCAAF